MEITKLMYWREHANTLIVVLSRDQTIEGWQCRGGADSATEMSLTATQPDLVWTAGGDIRVEGHASNVKTGEVVTCLLIRSQGRKARPCERDNG
ncbi:hypothetical protein PQR68_11470 [Paraburkholderia agricolaris]|uniref:hypothetical protein n=1 Tax=Paraburkholderia agricolaris TaxID=2152888 RepID=UPI0038B7537F